MTYPIQRLSHVASTRTSTVDKKSYDGELPVRLCNYTDVYKNGAITLDMNFMVATATSEQVMKFGLKIGDTVFTKDSESADDIGVPAFIVESSPELVCGYHLAIARPYEDSVHPRFLYWCLASPETAQQWTVLASGVTRVGLRQGDIGKLEVPVPSLESQSEIANFLDRETAQIDELIAKQERLIELLAAKRQAVITHSVTKGLDPNAPMKPSGIPWLGGIPAHWTITRLKFTLRRIEQGVSPQADAVPADSGYWGVLKSGCVNGGDFTEKENKQLPIEYVIDPAIAIKVGDLLVSRASGSPKLVGSAARVRSLSNRLILSDKTFRFVPASNTDPDFLEWFLNSRPYREQVEGSISGAEGLANNISTAALKNIRLAVPPLVEQKRISTDLRQKITALEHLEQSARKAVDLLRERRSALISAAVTGKLAVTSQLERSI